MCYPNAHMFSSGWVAVQDTSVEFGAGHVVQEPSTSCGDSGLQGQRLGLWWSIADKNMTLELDKSPSATYYLHDRGQLEYLGTYCLI